MPLRRLLLPVFALLVLLAPASAHARVVHPAPWSANFETGNLSQWSFWGQTQGYMWGHVKVEDPARAGIPDVQGRRAVRFETTPHDVRTGHINAKIFKWWDRPRRGRWDVSGSYCADYYFPRTYHATPRTADMVLEFKQEWTDRQGFHQNATWWIEIDTAREWNLPASRPDAPVAVLYHEHPRMPVTPKVVPLGRWFPLCMKVSDHKSIAATMDGRRLGIGYESQYFVGPQRQARRWIMGVGNYSQTANGPLWIDTASYRPS